MICGGLRTNSVLKKNTKENPLITVITVVYNDASHLENTILNIINQTYKNIEYIIIDGNSSDGTLDLIRKYEDKIDYWQSEPDKGIYDAMNKGILLATGEWLCFMNSGDLFASDNVISEVSKYNQDIIFGDVLVDNHSENKILLKQKDNFRFFFFAREATICHQSLFARKKTFDNNLFDTNYRIVADRVWLKHAVEDMKSSYIHINLPVCIYDNFGVSSNLKKQNKENIRFIKKEYGLLGVVYAYLIRFIYKILCMLRRK